MGLLDRLKNAFGASKDTVPQPDQSIPPVSDQALSKSEKERIMVERVTAEDMKQFASSPFFWNRDIRKYIAPNSHPFAYMDISGVNVGIAKKELEKINLLIQEAGKHNRSIPRNISIPVEEIVFAPRKDYGYTRIICTPHTFTGKTAKYPYSLSFMTDMASNINTTHGDLFYGQDGTVKKADIYFWRKSRSCFLHFVDTGSGLSLAKVE